MTFEEAVDKNHLMADCYRAKERFLEEVNYWGEIKDTEDAPTI